MIYPEMNDFEKGVVIRRTVAKNRLTHFGKRRCDFMEQRTFVMSVLFGGLYQQVKDNEDERDKGRRRKALFELNDFYATGNYFQLYKVLKKDYVRYFMDAQQLEMVKLIY